jgi:hypothetical protein
MADEELGLAEAIEAVRSELRRAQDAGRESDVRFAVGNVEVEFAVAVTKTGGGEASVTVLGLLSLAGKGSLSRDESHRVKISLSPIGSGGQAFEVASPAVRRPDGEPAQ